MIVVSAIMPIQIQEREAFTGAIRGYLAGVPDIKRYDSIRIEQ